MLQKLCNLQGTFGFLSIKINCVFVISNEKEHKNEEGSRSFENHELSIRTEEVLKGVFAKK